MIKFFFQNFAKYKVQAISKPKKSLKTLEKSKTQPNLQKYSVQGFFKKKLVKSSLDSKLFIYGPNEIRLKHFS